MCDYGDVVLHPRRYNKQEEMGGAAMTKKKSLIAYIADILPRLKTAEENINRLMSRIEKLEKEASP
jgi:hypothetical protein